MSGLGCSVAGCDNEFKLGREGQAKSAGLLMGWAVQETGPVVSYALFMMGS